MYRKQVRRRQAVLLLLVVASLTLLSLYYREGSGVRCMGSRAWCRRSSARSPRGADRALKPVRDLVNWFDQTFEARGEDDRLRDGVASPPRLDLARAQVTKQEAEELSRLDELTRGGIVPDGSEPVTARVVGRSPTVWYSTVTDRQGH